MSSRRSNTTMEAEFLIEMGLSSRLRANCSVSSESVLSLLIAASATFALNAAVWFRRGRLLICSPLPSHLMAADEKNLHLAGCPVFPAHLSLGAAQAEERSEGAEQQTAGTGICACPIPRHAQRRHQGRELFEYYRPHFSRE